MNKKAYSYAIKLLTKRDYSKFKLSEKLKSKDFTSDEISDVIEYLLEKKYLREDYYLEARVKGLLRKNYGAYYIIQKLQQEFVECSEEYISATYIAISLTPQEQIMSITEKKLRLLNKNLERHIKKNKLLTLVQSKGHQISQAYPIIEKLL